MILFQLNPFRGFESLCFNPSIWIGGRGRGSILEDWNIAFALLLVREVVALLDGACFLNAAPGDNVEIN